MRENAKQTKTVNIARVQDYHEGRTTTENYAYNGFTARKYYTSDRTIPLDENYQRADGKPLKAYGLEIETECQGITVQRIYAEILEKIVFSKFPNDLFKMQNDRSLRGQTSSECITQPMTKEFIRNNYANFKLMYDEYFPAFAVSCSRSGNCGMHVNISTACFGRTAENQADAIRKLYYIINHHFNAMCHLFKRNTARTDYCGRMTAVKSECKTMNLSHFSSDHFVCFNLGHYNVGRIELRLVAGQPNFPGFRNTMESIFWLVDRVKTISWNDCDDLVKIFSGCNQYVCDRIKSDLYAVNDISAEQYEAIKRAVVREELI